MPLTTPSSKPDTKLKQGSIESDISFQQKDPALSC
jgi:hypothetical protein